MSSSESESRSYSNTSDSEASPRKKPSRGANSDSDSDSSANSPREPPPKKSSSSSSDSDRGKPPAFPANKHDSLARKGIPLNLAALRKDDEPKPQAAPYSAASSSSDSSKSSKSSLPIPVSGKPAGTPTKPESARPPPKDTARSDDSRSSRSSVSSRSSRTSNSSRSRSRTPPRPAQRSRSRSPDSDSSRGSRNSRGSRGSRSYSSRSRSRSRSRDSRSSRSSRRSRSSRSSRSLSRTPSPEAFRREKYQGKKEYFIDLPEPLHATSFKVHADAYLRSIEDNVEQLHQHLRVNIQQEEGELLHKFSYDLSKCDGTISKKEDEIRLRFLKDLQTVRQSRRQYRELIFDALRERNSILESKVLQIKGERDLQAKGDQLRRSRAIDLPTSLFFIFQVILILFFIVFVEYSPASDELNVLHNVVTHYRFYSGIAFMLFVGYTFIGSYLRRYSISAVAFILLLSVVAIQWGILWNYWWRLVNLGSSVKLAINVQDLIGGLYSAITCAISFGFVLGRATPLQGLVMVFLECFFYALNVFINSDKILALDLGGSMYIHLFGAFFGMGVSLFLYLRSPEDDAVALQDKAPSYRTETTAMIGTIFLWVLFPSFNAALAADADQASRAIINTTLALSSSCVFVFAMSSLYRKRKGIAMDEVRNATLAGGIGVAAMSNLVIGTWAAILTGMFSAVICMFGMWWLNHKIRKLRDTRSTLSVHGLTGIVGGLACAIAAGAGYVGSLPKYEQYFYKGLLASYFPRGQYQGGFQIAALVITMALALVSGLLTGIAMYWLSPKSHKANFSDDTRVHVAEDFPAAF